MDNLPIVQPYTDQIIYRASALGGCPRSLWASRKQYTPKPFPKKFQDIFSRGHEIEDITKSILLSAGWILINNQYEVVVKIPPITELIPIKILGHIDCDSQSPTIPGWVLTEIKGFGKAYLDKYIKTDILGFPNYAYQISAYLHARTQQRWRFIVYQKTHDSAEDSFTRLIIREYERPPLTLEQLQLRVELIEIAAQSTAPQDIICTSAYPCPYYYLHDTPTPSIPLTQQQLALARTIKTLDSKVKKLEGLKQTLRGKLQGQLDDDEVKYTAAGISIGWQKKADQLTTAAVRGIMREAGVEESDYVKRGEGKQMVIREKGEKD